jgi:hypothetical protein
MADIIYHIRIKKAYAGEALKKLIRDEAIEMAVDSIPGWQKKETLARLKEMKENPLSVVSKDDFFESLYNGKDTDV